MAPVRCRRAAGLPAAGSFGMARSFRGLIRKRPARSRRRGTADSWRAPGCFYGRGALVAPCRGCARRLGRFGARSVTPRGRPSADVGSGWGVRFAVPSRNARWRSGSAACKNLGVYMGVFTAAVRSWHHAEAARGDWAGSAAVRGHGAAARAADGVPETPRFFVSRSRPETPGALFRFARKPTRCLHSHAPHDADQEEGNG